MLNYINEILFLIGRKKNKLFFIVFLYFIASFLDVIGISLIAPFINLFSNNVNFNNSYLKYLSKFANSSNKEIITVYLGALLVIIFLIKTITSIVINRINLSFSSRQDSELRIRLMDYYQNLDYEDFTNKNSSDLILRVRNHANEFIYNCLIPLFRLLSESIICIIILFFLFYVSYLAMIVLGSLLLIFFISYDFFIRKKIVIAGEESLSNSLIMTKTIKDALTGFKEIRVLGQESYFRKILSNSAKLSAKAQEKHLALTFIPRYLLEFTIVIFMVSFPIILISTGRSTSNVFSILGIFGVSAIRIIPSINIIFQSITTLRYVRPAVGLIYKDLSSTQKSNTSKMKQTRNNKFISLELKNVLFKYKLQKKWALNDINLKLNRGESIGFVGFSGSGKTTLIDIILGLLSPLEGEVFLNGNKLLDSTDLLKESFFAYLPQQIFLIDDTLRKNIALGIEDDDIDDLKILKCIELAMLNDFYKSLNNGLDSFVGENGIRISGGQKQRIALARAFYHNREVLVMDESTSALDNETEKDIVENIKLLKGDKTLIIIAHRLTTLQYCDKIYQLQDGKITIKEN
jgi:ABC-type multidrug transport system fused ATPase/permease subunit